MGDRAITMLKNELERTMALAGCNSVTKLGRSYVRRRHGG